MRRVAVTGIGAVTPIGNNVDEYWESLKNGRIGFDFIKGFDTAEYKVKLAAQVKDFNPQDYMDFKSAKRMEPFSQYAMAAAKQAMDMSGLDMSKEDPYRAGALIGSGIGGLMAIENAKDRLNEKGPGRMSPMLVPTMITNMAAGNISIAYGLKGKSFSLASACATGTHSIGEALRTIQCGEADIMLAGGCESSITPVAIAGFAALNTLSTSEDPSHASIPFDRDRNGFVMGEGAGVVVLEELEHAKKRGAEILCELVGYGATSDAFHITLPDEKGEGDAKAMELAIAEAGVKPSEIDYINAHGTSTHFNDLYETIAIKKALGEAAYKTRISSTKSMTGHLLGAAGAIEFVATVLCLVNNFAHGTIGTENVDEQCDLHYLPGKGEACDIRVALSNSLGFGGHNAAVVIKKYEG